MYSADVRAQIRYSSVLLNVLKHYMSIITILVECNTRSRLPDHFTMVLSGYKTPEAHYVSYFASYPFKTSLGYSSVFLTLSPLKYEMNQDTNE